MKRPSAGLLAADERRHRDALPVRRRHGLMLITVLGLAMGLSIGCGVNKPDGDAGGGSGGKSSSGSGGNSGGGSGGHRGSGGFSFAAAGFDVNLDGINLS